MALAPGLKEGKPVPVIATIEVNFRFPQMWFDAKAEQRRTSFNVALQSLKTGGARKDRAVQSVQDLARDKFPPAMYLVGTWELAGDNIPKDPADGWELIQKAAGQNYGPALYTVGKKKLDAGGSHEETENAWSMLRDAATLGSVDAQFFLGGAYEKGVGVPMDASRARRYFRLCATTGIAPCQIRLARLLLEIADNSGDDHVQAVAWLQLAADQNDDEARQIADREQAKLNPTQLTLVKTWKGQLLRK